LREPVIEKVAGFAFTEGRLWRNILFWPVCTGGSHLVGTGEIGGMNPRDLGNSEKTYREFIAD